MARSENVFGHRRANAKHSIDAGSDDLIDLTLQLTGIEESYRDRLTTKHAAQRPELLDKRPDTLKSEAANPPAHRVDMTQIATVVHQASERNIVPSGQVLNDVERTNLVALIGRKGNAVRQQKQIVHQRLGIARRLGGMASSIAAIKFEHGSIVILEQFVQFFQGRAALAGPHDQFQIQRCTETQQSS